ncbi:transmembrane proteins 14C-domain-containing protein [Amylocarpus encephaloides]|uniref:Transmembrane proteins 14C-domain-containing protein n=1 Tax=Amylocarpus encephaloides TaxID=45428 RepID=A0A9P7YGH9_9HELO|nr:transmembrane proteins 14C-domain-containing protein [Amylocarpus encephaloides]
MGSGRGCLQPAAALRWRTTSRSFAIQRLSSSSSEINIKFQTREKIFRSIKMAIETPAYIIGALTASGGTFGYVKTGSIPSIVAGLTVGTLYLLGGYRIQNRLSYGIELALLASIVLAGSSIPRAIRGQKPLPIGLSALALYGLFTFGNAWRTQK